MAGKKYLDSVGTIYLVSKIKSLLSEKVDRVDGKVLSSNDYTNEEKVKLSGIEIGANKYVLPTASKTVSGGVKVGTNLTITNGVLNASGTNYDDASQTTHGLMSAADKTKLDGFDSASMYALKSDITNMYKFKGTVETENDLPTSGMQVGDTYNIVEGSSYGAEGMNVAWEGTKWDSLGGLFAIDTVTTEEIDAMFE